MSFIMFLFLYMIEMYTRNSNLCWLRPTKIQADQALDYEKFCSSQISLRWAQTYALYCIFKLVLELSSKPSLLNGELVTP